MIYKVRRGVFETNSSSTHSITMCSNEEYEAWKAGKMVYDCDAEELVSLRNPEFLMKFQKVLLRKQTRYNAEDERYIAIQTILDCIENGNKMPIPELERRLKLSNYETYDGFYDDSYAETFCTSYKTKSGEEVIAFGKYSAG